MLPGVIGAVLCVDIKAVSHVNEAAGDADCVMATLL